jgi:transcription initiation factor IIE alpha subunit
MANLVRLLGDRMRMLAEDAKAVAHVVEEAFKGQSEVDDESLPKDVRQVFYDLQNEKILDVRRDESRLDGAQRRHYYWRVRDEHEIGELAETRRPDPEERLYDRLSESAWERRRPGDE